jgi:hypothetical protein
MMASDDKAGDRITLWMRRIAQALTATWAGVWTYLAIQSAFSEGLTALEVLQSILGPALILFFGVGAALASDLWGGVVLVLCGIGTTILALVTYGVESIEQLSVVLLTTAQPPLMAAALLLLAWHRSRRT